MADYDKDLIKNIIESNLTLPEENKLEGKGWLIAQEQETIEKLFIPRRIVTKETSLERIERKIDSLMRDVATRDDIIAQTAVLLENQKKLNEELLIKLKTLRALQINNVSHRRLARYATIFFVFFAISFLMREFLGLTIVTSFWNNIGLVLSFGFWLMALAMKKDWKNEVEDGE